MSNGLEYFFLLSLACCWPGLVRSQLEIVKQWPLLDFAFPDEATKNVAIEKKYFVPGNSIAMDVDVHYSSQGGGSPTPRIFVTSPRFDEGTPITLGTVDDQGKVNAYPDYSWHDNQGQNCDGFTCVFRTAMDECNRMWVMDTGVIGEEQSCPPKLVAFNLDTDELIYSHIVNASNYIATSLFITPVVDLRRGSNGDCSDTFVYVADVSGFGFLVVDVKNDRSWRATHRLTYPFPSRGTFTIEGVSFDLMDGVLGMALSPYHSGDDRLLFFHALASTTENFVRTSVIRNDSFINNPAAPANSMHVFPRERPNQSAAEAMDRNGIMYFGLMNPPSIWCWNSATEYGQRNFYKIDINRKTLQFASGVKVIDNPNGEQELWVLTCRFQMYATGGYNANETNFRILTGTINDLLENSPCKNGPRGQNH